MLRFGGIEAGGTKFVCAVGTGPGDLETAEFPTSTPDNTLGPVVQFFAARQPIQALGIGSFGPIDPHPSSPTFGYITDTPKLAWRGFDFAGTLRRALHVEVAFDTDVNAAALAEFRWGAARGLGTFLYVTVGTGLGGGAMVGGHLLHGRMHPEMGHIHIPHDLARDPFPGNCPFHADCLEGLAAGPAIQARWGLAPHLLPDTHPAWELEADYLALGIVNWTYTLAPELVILGGGILRREELLFLVRKKTANLLNGYLDAPRIVRPALGERAGMLGAIALAAELASTLEAGFAS